MQRQVLGGNQRGIPIFLPQAWRLLEQLIAKGGGGKKATDTGGGPRLLNQKDVLPGDVEAGLEGIDQLSQPAHLDGGGERVIKITDQADADAPRVDAVRAGRGEGRALVAPALAELDFPIGASIPIADEEMIFESAAGLAQGDGIARRSGAVVDVDAGPSVRTDGSLGGKDGVEGSRRFDGEKAVGRSGRQGCGGEGQKQRGRQGQSADQGAENDQVAVGGGFRRRMGACAHGTTAG